MLNIEKYRAKLENYEIPLDCYIREIREKCKEGNDSCGSKRCVECRKENIGWLLSEHQILDNTEKRYLRGVIRPFRNKVLNIQKKSNFLEWISIVTTDHEIIKLPFFDKSSGMYKGMEIGKEYTLEELGL